MLPQTNSDLWEFLSHTIEMEKMTVDIRPPETSEFMIKVFPIMEQVAIFLHLELQYHGAVEQAKLELENCRDFSSMNLYKCIDINNLNYISIPSLLKFFLKFKIKLPKKYTDAFYRRTNVKLNMMMTF